VGNFVHNNRQGEGRMVYESGNTYEGGWFANLRHGTGVMNWTRRNEKYTGSWERGLQNGMGEYIWYLKRFAGSQYPARNRYVGHWTDAQREGQGVYVYASGAVYDGEWVQDLKEGRGTYTFDNGYVYEGLFTADAMLDEVDAAAYDQYLYDVEDLIAGEAENTEKVAFEMERLRHAMLLHVSDLLNVYTYYSSLGCISPDNTFLMTRLQFHRMLKDSGITGLGMSLCDVDRVIQVVCSEWSLHSPTDTLLPRQFMSCMIRVAYHLFAEHHTGLDSVLASCVNSWIAEHVLRNFGSVDRVKGYLFKHPEHAKFVSSILDNLPELCRLYDLFAINLPNGDRTLSSRGVLLMMNELNCFSLPSLSPETPVKIMELDNPDVMLDGVLDMHVELSHLEMLEVFVGCAVWEEVEDEEVIIMYNVPTIVEGIVEEGADDNEESVAVAATAATPTSEGGEDDAAADDEVAATLAVAAAIAAADAEKSAPPPPSEATIEKAKKGSRSRNVSESMPDDAASSVADEQADSPEPTPPPTASRIRVSISAQGSFGDGTVRVSTEIYTRGCHWSPRLLA
jgi:hypothetical protein